MENSGRHARRMQRVCLLPQCCIFTSKTQPNSKLHQQIFLQHCPPSPLLSPGLSQCASDVLCQKKRAASAAGSNDSEINPFAGSVRLCGGKTCTARVVPSPPAASSSSDDCCIFLAHVRRESMRNRARAHCRRIHTTSRDVMLVSKVARKQLCRFHSSVLFCGVENELHPHTRSSEEGNAAMTHTRCCM